MQYAQKLKQMILPQCSPAEEQIFKETQEEKEWHYLI